MGTDVLEQPAPPVETERDGGRPPGPVRGGDGDPGGGEPQSFDTTRFGLWLFLGTLTMLFIGFTSAYLVRRAGGDWQPLPVPGWLWGSTAALVASGITLERARKRLRDWDPAGATAALGWTGLLGAGFVAAQLAAWQQLAGYGYFLATNPHNSFFYVLTGLHGVHVVSALIWFAVVYYRARSMKLVPGGDGLGLFATFWHYLAGLWIYLLVLLFLV